MNYGLIKTMVAGYAQRSDLTALMDGFLALAEQRIYLGEANTSPLRTSDMLKTLSPFTTLPADYLEAKRVSMVQSSTIKFPLEFAPLESIAAYETQVGAGGYYSFNGGTLVLGPTAPYPVELIYYARLASPVLDTDENAIMKKAPNVYITSMLVEAARYAQDNELLAREAGNYASAVTAYQNQDDDAQHSGAALRMMSDARRLI